MRNLAFPFVLILSALVPIALSAQFIRVHIDPENKSESFVYQAMGDEVWILNVDSFPEPILKLEALDQVKIEPYMGRVRISMDGNELGRYKKIRFFCNDANPKFNLILDRKRNPVISYSHHLEVEIKGKGLRLVNEVFMEPYIEGVVNAEAGHHRSLEFFKVQAVSARTYALRNTKRHAKQGYNLCDNTHCQAYKGIPRNQPLIEKAVRLTDGEVITFEGKMIQAVFSANCGGFTANSEDVWVSKVEYLRSMPDYDLCEGTNNHAWHIMIPKWEFLSNLGKYHKTEATSFKVEPDVSGRVKRIEVNNNPTLVISGEEIRRMLKLKSSKFHLYESGNMLFIEGAGFGHGVGMCQDGAYRLSEIGLDYDKIIKHYYQGVEVAPLEVWANDN